MDLVLGMRCLKFWWLFAEFRPFHQDNCWWNCLSCWWKNANIYQCKLKNKGRWLTNVFESFICLYFDLFLPARPLFELDNNNKNIFPDAFFLRMTLLHLVSKPLYFLGENRCTIAPSGKNSNYMTMPNQKVQWGHLKEKSRGVCISFKSGTCITVLGESFIRARAAYPSPHPYAMSA